MALYAGFDSILLSLSPCVPTIRFEEPTSGPDVARIHERYSSDLNCSLSNAAWRIKVLMADDGIGPVFEKALKAAADRSRELAG